MAQSNIRKSINIIGCFDGIVCLSELSIKDAVQLVNNLSIELQSPEFDEKCLQYFSQIHGNNTCQPDSENKEIVLRGVQQIKLYLGAINELCIINDLNNLDSIAGLSMFIQEELSKITELWHTIKFVNKITKREN